MPNFVMLVGVPGSGKSTYAKKLREAAVESDYYTVSRDDCVLLLGQQALNKEHIMYDEAWKAIDHKMADRMVNNRLQDALSIKANIILDMTNLTKKSRAKRLASVGSDYVKTVMYFPIEYGEMMRRACLRQAEGKHISTKVLVEMYQQIEEPTAAEGFNILGTR